MALALWLNSINRRTAATAIRPTTETRYFSSLRSWAGHNHNGVVNKFVSLPGKDEHLQHYAPGTKSRNDRPVMSTPRYRAKVGDKYVQVGRWAWDVFPLAHNHELRLPGWAIGAGACDRARFSSRGPYVSRRRSLLRKVRSNR